MGCRAHVQDLSNCLLLGLELFSNLFELHSLSLRLQSNLLRLVLLLIELVDDRLQFLLRDLALDVRPSGASEDDEPVDLFFLLSP